MSQVTPEKIMHLGLGFWGSKTLLSAVEIGVFSELAKGPEQREKLIGRLGLHPRGARDFLDALVALGMLNRDGDSYSNTPESDLFLDRHKPTYVGGILEMANARLYHFWNSLTEALRTGQHQNESKGGKALFESLYADPARLKGFLAAMSGISAGSARAIAAQFPWAKYKSFADLGCAQGMVPVTVAQAHPHLKGVGFDLAEVGPIFEEFVSDNKLTERVEFQGGSFFDDPLPKTEVHIFGHILHDWDLAKKRQLLQRSHDALPAGGAVVVYDAIIDDERKKNAFGLLMSLNMLIETDGGFDYTGADCVGWMKEAGFKEVRVEHLVGPDSMVIGVK
ncbi:MAG: methyltransferase [Planctomycetota bacterium]